jgi:hypothetical protein
VEVQDQAQAQVAQEEAQAEVEPAAMEEASR